MPQPRQSRSRGKAQSHGKAEESHGNQSHGNQPDSQGKQSDSHGKEAAASSPGSSAAAGSSRLHVVNPGPAFEPRDLVEEDAGAGAVAGDVIGAPLPIVEQWWTPERAEYLVRGQGAITHALIGVGESDWVWQPVELQAVAAPLANSLNGVEPLRRMAPYADSIGALMGIAAYIGRSRRERAAVLAAGGPPREVPVTGVDAAGEPVDNSRRSQIVDRVLGRKRAPEPEQPTAGDEAGSIEWRVGP